MGTIVLHWNQESEEIPIFVFLLHVLWRHMGSNSTTLKLEIGSNPILRIPLHVLCYHIGIESATLKSEIGNHEIGNFNFCRERALVSLNVLWCRIGTIVQHWNWELEVIPISAFPLHVLWYRMGSTNATLKPKIGRNFNFSHFAACALLLHWD